MLRVLGLCLLGSACTASPGESALRWLEPADLTDPEVLPVVTELGSGMHAYSLVYRLMRDDLQDLEEEERDCATLKSTLDEQGFGTVTVRLSDCEPDGGSARFVHRPSGDRRYRYKDVVLSESDACDGVSRLDGEVRLDADGAFGLSLVIRSEPRPGNCNVPPSFMVVEYSGIMTESPDDGRIEVNGSGRVGDREHGWVHISTDSQRYDSEICEGEALSGTTTVTSGPHTAVIIYDGLTDCDPSSTATWSLDGEDQGEMDAIGCSTVSAWPGVAGLGLAGLALWRRRRRRADRAPTA